MNKIWTREPILRNSFSFERRRIELHFRLLEVEKSSLATKVHRLEKMKTNFSKARSFLFLVSVFYRLLYDRIRYHSMKEVPRIARGSQRLKLLDPSYPWTTLRCVALVGNQSQVPHGFWKFREWGFPAPILFFISLDVFEIRLSTAFGDQKAKAQRDRRPIYFLEILSGRLRIGSREPTCTPSLVRFWVFFFFSFVVHQANFFFRFWNDEFFPTLIR